ncbi:MAG: hypothetical protein DRG78_07180 [Epsilonproteobacteria bacterium]|nr:MAG: hypothetical protein DRG78_07180 [Campylobacterota bacterium]
MQTKQLNLNNRKVTILSILFFFMMIGIYTYNSYLTMQKAARKAALTESKLLTNYMFVHRQYYINLYATKAIPLDVKSLRGLPAYSARPIANIFSNSNDYGIKIKLASDRPRNPNNLADKQEQEAINYFNKNRNKKEYFKLIEEESNAPYYQYGYVLNVKRDCLVCHSKPQNAPKFIAEKYKTAYGYKLGDLRGIISIKVPKNHADEYVGEIFSEQIKFNIFMFILFFIAAILVFVNKARIMKALEKQTLNAKKANSAKSEFLANMSHEIRTPLNAILGFVDMIKGETKETKTAQYIDIVDKSSKNLLQIIEDILDFSKIESGKLDIEKVDFNAKAEFEVITHLFQAKCSQKNISLILNIDENLPQIINSDPLRIKQVITNLMSNAVKFTTDGKNIIVTINYSDNLLFVSVKDQGIGVAKDKLSYIFDTFSQEDSSTTRKYGGTGLGLSISSELVELLGGELKVKSEVGVGSEFYFSIPVTIGKELKIENNNNQGFDFVNKKILLVEDNKANQMFMKVILQKMNLEFDTANDGLEAIEKFKDNKYDAILMDENMPNMNGIEATKRILEIEKEHNLPHTPIIALTANALKGDRERFLDAGMDEYLTKPIDKQKMGETLKKILIKEYLYV